MLIELSPDHYITKENITEIFIKDSYIVIIFKDPNTRLAIKPDYKKTIHQTLDRIIKLVNSNG